MKRVFAVGFLFCLNLLSATAIAAESLRVQDPWIREAPPNAMALGAFMTVTNSSDKARVMVKVSSAVAEKVELHRTVMEDGVAKMIAQAAIEVPAKGEVKLAPGGLHIMLINPKQALKAGDKVEITLEFKDGARIPVTFEVRRGDMPMKMDMNMEGGHSMDSGHHH
jgi:copper(I)-binding protein